MSAHPISQRGPLGRRCVAGAVLAAVTYARAAPAAGPRLQSVEIGAQAVAALVTDTSVKGGGVGCGLELGLPLVLPSLRERVRIVPRARLSALTGLGLAWAIDVGVSLRLLVGSSWQPEVGVFVAAMGGDLARTIDERGRLAHDPITLQLGLSPLRFRLQHGWVALLAPRYAPSSAPLGEGLALSVALAEVGQSF